MGNILKTSQDMPNIGKTYRNKYYCHNLYIDIIYILKYKGGRPPGMYKPFVLDIVDRGHYSNTLILIL